MSVNSETASVQGQTTVLAKESVYASLFEKINLTPASSLGDINAFLDDAALSDAPAGERLTAAMQVFMDCIRKSGQQVEKLDKTLIDHHIAELDFQISRQLDAVMHHQEFQKVESLWRGLKQLVDSTDYRQNVKTEILDVSKDDLRQDFEDAPELIQSGLYWHTYTAEYDTPGGEPIGSVISSYEFDASPQDVALLRNISKVSAAAHMPFIGAVGPKFFLKDSMEEVAAIKDIGNYFDRAEYIKWKSFRDTDDSRYIGLVMPRVLGRLPYGPDTVPVRSFNYVEQVKGPDHEKYLWTSASFSFASNMVKSFINNGWCVQIRGPQAGGAVKDLPIHLYDLGTGNQVKIPSEVMIPETREFEFANLGFIPLSYYKNRDYACFFSANSAQKAGEEFARAHPEQAVMLNLDKSGARDPYVERLFEGFAFLMGRLREKLDDDLPELTEGLVSLLWPHYLRTIPSMSVVEFTPDWREMKEQMRIVKGFEVNSRPIGEKGTCCRYTTTKEITLQPLSLEHARLSTDSDGRSVISLRFNCSHLADWGSIDLSQLPFYFNADAPLACAMHEAFTALAAAYAGMTSPPSGW